jgi:hypothetical protein
MWLRGDIASPLPRQYRSLGRRAVGVCALLATAALFGALFAAAKAAPVQLGSTGGAVTVAGLATQLRLFHRHQSLQVVALALKVGAFVAVALVVWFMAVAMKHREGRSRAWLTAVGLLGVALTIGSSVFGYSELAHVATRFVQGATTAARARTLVSHSSELRATTVVEVVCRLVFAAWLVTASYIAGRVGLLTRFLSMFGIAAAAAWGLLIPAGESLFIGWLGSLGFIMAGYWPGGVPEGWNEERASQPVPAKRRAVSRAKRRAPLGRNTST